MGAERNPGVCGAQGAAGPREPRSYRSCVQGTLVTGWEGPGAGCVGSEACGRAELCVGFLEQLHLVHRPQMCFSCSPGPRRCHDPLGGHETTQRGSAPSSPASPVPIHTEQKQQRYQEPSSGKRSTMPGTSQHNCRNIQLLSHISGLEETQQSQIYDPRAPQASPASPSQPVPWHQPRTGTGEAWQLLQRATGSSAPGAETPFPFKKQLKVSYKAEHSMAQLHKISLWMPDWAASG